MSLRPIHGHGNLQNSWPSLHLAAARLLLALTGLLLLVMPFTEHLCAFDRFLRGGQDLELSLFAILAVFGLVLLLAHSCQRALGRLFALTALWNLPWPFSPQSRGGGVLAFLARCMPSVLVRSTYPTPLQI